MLTIEQRANAKTWRYAGDGAAFVNQAFLVGKPQLDLVDKGILWLHQTINPAHAIPVQVPAAMQGLLRSLADGVVVSVACRIRSAWQTVPVLATDRIQAQDAERREPIAVADVLSIQRANVLEQHPDSAMAFLPRMRSAAADSSIDLPHEHEAQIASVPANRKGNANTVYLSGFIQHTELRPQDEFHGARLTIHLRQTADPSAVIPIRIYGNTAMRAAEIVDKGSPISIIGSLRVDAKRILAPGGAADQESPAVQPLHKTPYVHASLPPQTVDEQLIRAVPEWAERLYVESRSQRQARVAS